MENIILIIYSCGETVALSFCVMHFINIIIICELQNHTVEEIVLVLIQRNKNGGTGK